MEEIWKPIVDPVVQDRYMISTQGRVFDVELDKYLNFFDNGAGYKVYGLREKKLKIPLTTTKTCFTMYTH